jgi:hypothetical protein
MPFAVEEHGEEAMNLRSIAVIASLGLAGALVGVGPAEAAHRDRDRGRRYEQRHHRSGRSYRGYSRSYGSYRPYVAYRPYRHRSHLRPYDYSVPYGYDYGYGPASYGYGYDYRYRRAPYVPYRPYCGPRVRVGIRLGPGW